MRVRDIHQEFTQESLAVTNVSLLDETTSASASQMSAIMAEENFATSSNSANLQNADANSSSSHIEMNEDELQELDDTSVSAIKNYLSCQGLEWNDVKRMWAKTYLARQEDIEHSTLKDVLQQWPKYLNARGMDLVRN